MHYMAQLSSEGLCTFGEQTTSTVGGGDLTARLDPIQFDIDFKWPVSFTFCFIYKF